MAVFLNRRAMARHQIYWAARDSPGIDNQFKCNFISVHKPHRTHNCTNTLYDYAIMNY